MIYMRLHKFGRKRVEYFPLNNSTGGFLGTETVEENVVYQKDDLSSRKTFLLSYIPVLIGRFIMWVINIYLYFSILNLKDKEHKL